ncbi:MAG TPA: hypothetical protein VJB37_00065 [Patescibacteria group bacterium]|nr:hypothetical protein [Patescibacteria group bacterium]
MKYVFSLLVIFLGVMMVVKTEWFIQNFGTSAWAEQHLGTSGGTRLMYKLLGLVFIFFAMLVVTGMMEGFLMSTIGRLFIF